PEGGAGLECGGVRQRRGPRALPPAGGEPAAPFLAGGPPPARGGREHQGGGRGRGGGGGCESPPPRPPPAAARRPPRAAGPAAEGLIDAQIAGQLGISPAAVALRWRSVYARVAERVPSALHDTAPSSAGRGRGHEKRRRVIAFVSEHPEEMRPYLAS